MNSMTYDVGDLPFKTLFSPVAGATEALVRLDERLARSPVRDGFGERQNFADAAAALWLEGELVHLEDLVLHDAHMDVRTPTHELTRAHAVLRARRQIFGRKPDWAIGRDGLLVLTRRGGVVPASTPTGRAGQGAFAAEVEVGIPDEADAPDSLAEEFAAIDAVIARSTKVLEGGTWSAPDKPASTPDRPPQNSLVYDLDWDENARLAEWRTVIADTQDLPVVLRAAILLDAWAQIEVLQHAAWLGPLLVAALLRQQGICASHLACLHLGAKNISWERRRARNRHERLIANLEAILETALAGLKEHDRLLLAKSQMERKLRNRRASSKLAGLVELAISRPLVSTSLIQERLKVTRQGALNLVDELALREMTGRGRFRAWGII